MSFGINPALLNKKPTVAEQEKMALAEKAARLEKSLPPKGRGPITQPKKWNAAQEKGIDTSVPVVKFVPSASSTKNKGIFVDPPAPRTRVSSPPVARTSAPTPVKPSAPAVAPQVSAPASPSSPLGRKPAELPAFNPKGMKKGGAAKSYKAGGTVSGASKRGDGIAIRGKTRGKIC